MTESEIIVKISNILLEKGYPVQSIVRDLRVDHIIVDLAIVPPNIGKPIAVFEIKTGPNLVTEQVKKFYETVNRKFDNCAVFFIANANISEEWKIGEYDSSGKNVYPIILKNEFPNYSELLSKFAINTNAENQIVRKKKVTTLKKICWIVIPTVALFMMILDWHGIYKITNQRLFFLAGVCVILLIPCMER